MEKVWEVLQDVKDPELPDVSIVEMGMVHNVSQIEGEIIVELMPTFVGCPALNMISEAIKVSLLKAGMKNINVVFVLEPPWTSERITEIGREKLKGMGISSETSAGITCPYCDSYNVSRENLFGPTSCRSIYYCRACKQPFESMKMV